MLRAGVIPELQNAPHAAVVFFNTWQLPEFEAALKMSIAAAVSQIVASPVSLDSLAVDDSCSNAPAQCVHQFPAFDQFETTSCIMVQRHADHDFDAELARLVNAFCDTDAHLMHSLREDGLTDAGSGLRFNSALGDLLRLSISIGMLRSVPSKP